ncbi:MULTISPECIES: NUDIX hydrolase [Exiguobacterium]|uniref:NUDIX hydrolase n=1 Tax=Exiguobacterium TaxID=33986 RepID=UPI001BE60F25|nr:MULTISPECIES: NUDIX domain-containing protein [Exiguobacterium]MCT4783622.1 NUDIX domain-containing protein [Exiguobacterium himgiriensis]
MIEFLTVVDERRKKIGLKPRADVHRDGDWHETFHCWMIEGEKLFLQLRSATKQDFPSLFDITAAGHLAAGETVRDGVREIQEELGLVLTLEQLTALGVYEDVIETESLRDREFAHTYVYTYAGETFTFESDEVADIVTVDCARFFALMTGEGASVEATSLVSEARYTLTKQDVVPHPDRYFQQVRAGIEEIRS